MLNQRWVNIFCVSIIVLSGAIHYCDASHTLHSRRTDLPTLNLTELREEVRRMFYHGYNSYLRFAFPRDELKPLSCSGRDTWGSYSLTLIDSLDTLVILGNYSEFGRAVRAVLQQVRFDKDLVVSVFETNIRIVGGLLSAYFFAEELLSPEEAQGLLNMAVDVARRLLPAFNTSTGIPYGSVNLLHGVPPRETPLVCVACTGTFSLEFGVLSRLTGDPSFEHAARRAVRAVWTRRTELGLLGNHIDATSGRWTHRNAGIGGGADSFFEYLLKAAVLFGDEEYYQLFLESYGAITSYLKRDPWYVDVSMSRGSTVWPLFSTLQAFWPGVVAMAGDVVSSADSLRAFHGVWRRFGATPEGFNLIGGAAQHGQKGYPLRPELAESLFVLSRALPHDMLWLRLARDIVYSLQRLCKVPCGYAAVADVDTHALDDRMDSFFLAETCKYLYLVFTPDHWLASVHDGSTARVVFNTEGHPMPLRFDLRNEWVYDIAGRLPKEDDVAYSYYDAELRGKCAVPPYVVRMSSDIMHMYHLNASAAPLQPPPPPPVPQQDAHKPRNQQTEESPFERARRIREQLARRQGIVSPSSQTVRTGSESAQSVENIATQAQANLNQS